MLEWKQQAPEWWESDVTFRLHLRGVRKIYVFFIFYIFMWSPSPIDCLSDILTYLKIVLHNSRTLRNTPVYVYDQ